MKNQKKFIAAAVVISILSSTLGMPSLTKAQVNYSNAENSVKHALSDKSFYSYNMAYAKIMELPIGYEKEKLLTELSAIASEVWTQDISEIVGLVEVMAKDKSGRAYDALEARIGTSNIRDVDKDYLYYELFSWGKNTVWTEDYKKAIQAVVSLWNNKTEGAYYEAEKAINEMGVEINKEYLTELFDEAKFATGVFKVLDSKYFNSTSNAVYTGNDKIVNIDLTSDKVHRTVTIKGSFSTLNINAPMATVILEDASIKKLNIFDVASTSVYLRGNTSVESLIVNDKDDNARIVLQGNANVQNTEVKSGAKLEVSSNSSASNPFGKLLASSDAGKTIDFAGDFKSTVITVNKSAVVNVMGTIAKVEFAETAKDSVINLNPGAHVREVNTKVALTVQGNGNVGTVTGAASNLVVNNIVTPVPTPAPNNGSDSNTPGHQIDVDDVRPVITLVGSSSVIVENGGIYTDLGATASDNIDGDITNKIVITIRNSTGIIVSSISTTIAGAYTVTYNVTDNAGNAAIEVVRTVTVLQPAEANGINNIVITPNKANGQLVIEGNIASGIGKNVTLQVFAPSGTIEYIGQDLSKEEGKFIFSFKISGTLSGTYTVKIGGEGITTPSVRALEF